MIYRVNLSNSEDFFLLDGEDFNLISRYTWRAQENGYIVTTNKRANPYTFPRPRICHKTIYLHKFILGVATDKNIYVDHKDRNKLNNTKNNLRPCSQSENMVNRLKYTSSSSRYKGVRFSKKCQKWESYITHKGKFICGGVYENEIEAAKQTDFLYTKYFGEFAVLNFPCQ